MLGVFCPPSVSECPPSPINQANVSSGLRSRRKRITSSQSSKSRDSENRRNVSLALGRKSLVPAFPEWPSEEFCATLPFSRVVILQVWSPAQQHQCHLGICQKCQFSGPNQTCCISTSGARTGNFCLTSPLNQLCR